jgi:SAM-dependent methyltransferase
MTTVLAPEESRLRDAYARRTNPQRYSWFDPAHLYAMQEVERGLLQLLREHGFSDLGDRDILDVGCGTGVWLRELVKWGARPERLAGVDLLADRISVARRQSPAIVQLTTGNAADLPFPDATFDVVLQSLVFTSILDGAVRRQVAAEMRRVVRPAGVILWYDYHVNNPANRDVRAVNGRELAQLFGGCDIDRRRVTLAPPLARFAAPRSLAAYRLLAAVPLLRTHYLAAIRPSAGTR